MAVTVRQSDNLLALFVCAIRLRWFFGVRLTKPKYFVRFLHRHYFCLVLTPELARTALIAKSPTPLRRWCSMISCSCFFLSPAGLLANVCSRCSDKVKEGHASRLRLVKWHLVSVETN